MFNCFKKRKKIIPIKRKKINSYSEYLNICIKDWEIKNNNLNETKIAPKPPTPVSTLSKYISLKKMKNKT